jgi:entericidin B
MKIVFKVVVLIAALAALSACETTKGVGRDVQNAGEALDEAM